MPTIAGDAVAELSVDQVTLTVIDNYLSTTCREMGLVPLTPRRLGSLIRRRGQKEAAAAMDTLSAKA